MTKLLSERHRRFQTLITVGTLVCAFLSLAHPELNHVSVVANVFVTMAWIWEA